MHSSTCFSYQQIVIVSAETRTMHCQKPIPIACVPVLSMIFTVYLVLTTVFQSHIVAWQQTYCAISCQIQPQRLPNSGMQHYLHPCPAKHTQSHFKQSAQIVHSLPILLSCIIFLLLMRFIFLFPFFCSA